MDELESYGTIERSMMTRAAQLNQPINGSLELLPLCNMNCEMCYVRLSKTEMEKQGRMRTGAEWLALGREMAKAGTLFLLLTGGEPLLHPDFKEIYLGLKKLGFILTVNTNGTLIDEAWADFFAQNKPRRINITLYGADETAYETLCHYKGGFEKTRNAVSLLRQRGVDVRLGNSITPTNVHDLEKIWEISAELDVTLINDSYMMAANRERSSGFRRDSRLSPEDAAAARVWSTRKERGEEWFVEYRKEVLAAVDEFEPGEETLCESTCLAGRCSFAINWQGRMRPCVITTEPQVDVFEQGFENAWRQMSEAYSQFRFCSECSVCRLRILCPVCPVACKTEEGDYMKKPEYLCRYAAETERLLRLSLEEEAHE